MVSIIRRCFSPRIIPATIGTDRELRIQEGDGLVCVVVLRTRGGGEASPADRGAFQKSTAITIRPVDLKNITAESRRLRDIYNQAWKQNWGFVPFTEKEFDSLAKELKPLALPDLVLIAEVDGQPVGFILSLPDINVALKKNQRPPHDVTECRSAWRSCSITRAA